MYRVLHFLYLNPCLALVCHTKDILRVQNQTGRQPIFLFKWKQKTTLQDDYLVLFDLGLRLGSGPGRYQPKTPCHILVFCTQCPYSWGKNGFKRRQFHIHCNCEYLCLCARHGIGSILFRKLSHSEFQNIFKLRCK